MWVDDQQDFLDLMKRKLENPYFNIKTETNPINCINNLELFPTHYSSIIIDLDMIEMDGIEVIKVIRTRNTEIPIIIVSAYTEQIKWKLRIDEVRTSVDNIIKKPIMPSRYDSVRETIIDVSLRYERKKSNDVNLLSDISTFKIPYNNFIQLPFKQKEIICDKVANLVSSFVDNYFNNNPTIDWLILAHSPDNVIASGAKDDEPDSEQLDEIAKKEGVPVFLYSNHIVLEENGVKWSNKGRKDYYPTISFEFMNQLITGDFDTGCTDSFISFEVANAMQIITYFNFNSTTNVWGKKVKYYKKVLHGSLLGKANHALKIKLICFFVLDWNRSPFCQNYADRKALFGRNLFKENHVKLILDGINKETDIYQ
jgi:CheY-like chemotaxis protein